jgi:hypothetical protein
MLDIVLWSYLFSLTPWALGLARKLISGGAGLISPAAPNGSVALPWGPACPEDLLRPITARDRLKILMRSNDNLIAMSASSLPRRGVRSVARQRRAGLVSGSPSLRAGAFLMGKECPWSLSNNGAK